MHNDLDDLVKYAREFKDDNVGVEVFITHMNFIYDELESLQKQINKLMEWANR